VVIGGGNSAVDSARVALRENAVKAVTIVYRRTRNEMPAFEEEVDAAIREGVELVTLATPVKVHTRDGHAAGVECLMSKLGEVDESGRRTPVPIERSEFVVPADTLIVAIGEQPESAFLAEAGIDTARDGTLIIDKDTLSTTRPGVFAGGDLVTGPNTVIDAIAAGKKAAVVIDRYLRGEELWRPPEISVPDVYVEPAQLGEEETEEEMPRVEIPELPVESRIRGFDEVEKTISAEAARRECRRCLRCDLEFTQREEEETETSVGVEERA
jgi:NADH-quinone oxidoreductase subunit F